MGFVFANAVALGYLRVSSTGARWAPTLKDSGQMAVTFENYIMVVNMSHSVENNSYKFLYKCFL